MEEAKAVKLYGMWASSFCMRIEMALKLKGIPYEYVEEDLGNKSQLLLQYNPVHKMVPVLVHDGRSIAESVVILEYIEDTWKDPPFLLPHDPYMRARVRFWAQFSDHALVDHSRAILKFKGEQQQAAIAEFRENLRILEEGIEKEFSGGKPFFNGKTPGLLDLVIGASSCWHKVLDEIAGVKLITRENNPIVCSWLDAFWDLDVVKATFPDHGRLTAYARRVRENALAMSP
ncbi:glutathione transferase GST 23-like [Magnolia sinica]|uniref:glutathione transferase GST 23-like n=1 Tax=Magnolia sinica TaxID=86752 RepID=UPI00265841A8|nr:glutathione transferase GST 23-like [Magnolia sinica]